MKLRSIVILVVFVLLVFLLGCGAYENFMNAYRTGSNIRSMIEIKNIAIALENYKVDHGEYPNAQSMEELQRVASNYIKNTAGVDRWGEAILVDCKPDGYLLSSMGDDKKGTHEFGGAVDFSGHSITMKDGVFVQYYARVERTAREYEEDIKALTNIQSGA